MLKVFLVKPFFHRLFNNFLPSSAPASDNTNVNLMEFGDRLFALTESPAINEINPDSLTVKEKVDEVWPYSLLNACFTSLHRVHRKRSKPKHLSVHAVYL